MLDVVTFGEAMIRLAPPHFQRLEQTSSLDVQVGGGELNVAVGASRLGLKSAWVSRLPKNALGHLMENRVRQAGVDTSHIIWADGGRMGLYFVEFGAAPRASSVLYDRADSAISAIKPGEVDWKGVFAGAKWFHTSGITPALSDSRRRRHSPSFTGRERSRPDGELRPELSPQAVDAGESPGGSRAAYGFR